MWCSEGQRPMTRQVAESSLIPKGGSFKSRTEKATNMPGKPHIKKATLQPADGGRCQAQTRSKYRQKGANIRKRGANFACRLQNVHNLLKFSKRAFGFKTYGTITCVN